MRIRVFDLSSPAGLWNTSPPAATVRVGGQAGARSCTTDPPCTGDAPQGEAAERELLYKQETVAWDTDSDSDESDDDEDLKM